MRHIIFTNFFFCFLIFGIFCRVDAKPSKEAVAIADVWEKALNGGEPLSLEYANPHSKIMEFYYLGANHYFGQTPEEYQKFLNGGVLDRYKRTNFDWKEWYGQSPFAVWPPDDKHEEVGRRAMLHVYALSTALSGGLLNLSIQSNIEFFGVIGGFGGVIAGVLGLSRVPAWIRGWFAHASILKSRARIDEALSILRSRGFTIPQDKLLARSWLLSHILGDVQKEWLIGHPEKFKTRLLIELEKFRTFVLSLQNSGDSKKTFAAMALTDLYKHIIKELFPKTYDLAGGENAFNDSEAFQDQFSIIDMYTDLTKKELVARYHVFNKIKNLLADTLKELDLENSGFELKLGLPEINSFQMDNQSFENLEAPPAIQFQILDTYFKLLPLLKARKLRLSIKMEKPYTELPGEKTETGGVLMSGFIRSPIVFKLLRGDDSSEISTVKWSDPVKVPPHQDLSNVTTLLEWQDAFNRAFEMALEKFGLGAIVGEVVTPQKTGACKSSLQSLPATIEEG